MIAAAIGRWLLAAAGFALLEIATRPSVALVERLETIAAETPREPRIRGPITPGDAQVPRGDRLYREPRPGGCKCGRPACTPAA